MKEQCQTLYLDISGLRMRGDDASASTVGEWLRVFRGRGAVDGIGGDSIPSTFFGLSRFLLLTVARHDDWRIYNNARNTNVQTETQARNLDNDGV